jgi:hypothetical protein
VGWTFQGSYPRSVFSSPKCPDQLCGPTSLLFIGYQGSFLGVKWPGQMTTHLHLVLKLKNECSHTSAPPVYIHGMERDNLTNSNKSPTRCNSFSSLLSLRLFTAQHVSGILTPIIRSSTTAVAASGFTLVSQRELQYEGKTRGYYCSCWAPDDGREDARNMWSCE